MIARMLGNPLALKVITNVIFKADVESNKSFELVVDALDAEHETRITAYGDHVCLTEQYALDQAD